MTSLGIRYGLDMLLAGDRGRLSRQGAVRGVHGEDFPAKPIFGHHNALQFHWGREVLPPLRRIMNAHSGFVVAFDNVPGAIFCGRKHGVFNTNTGNAVRAAITVVEDVSAVAGFRFSPLIRFKSEERSRLLTCAVLEAFLGNRRQQVTPTMPMFAKCDRRLEAVYEAWVGKSDSRVGFHVGDEGRFSLSVPSTCRYFTVATDGRLSRKGQMTLNFSDEDVYWYVFCMINSSFAYWHWRMFDGGIILSRQDSALSGPFASD